MKYLLPFVLFLTNAAFNQSPNYRSDTESINSIIMALYEVISGDKGVERDWERFNNLFTPEARLIPSVTDQNGNTQYNIMSPGDYIEASGQWLLNNGFHEIEIKREVQQYGNIAHVWSTYAGYNNKMDSVPFIRGINSIQLFHDGQRWWVKHIYWTPETPNNPLPLKYLPE